MPELFADLAEGASAVRQFFPDPPDADSLRACAASAQARSIPRAELCNLLLKQAEWFACGERSIVAIQKLHSPKTVAIVASLHPGLFGGTLDGWLKLCTAARLAAWLEEDGIPAVPVGWMDPAVGAAGQRVMILSSSGLRRYELDPSANGEAATSRRVESLLDQIACASGLVAAESDLLMLLKTAYLPDGDLRRGCGRTLARRGRSG